MKNPWQGCLAQLEAELSPQLFNTWIRPLQAHLAGGKAMRLTTGVGIEQAPSFSPDGQTIAFTGEKGADCATEANLARLEDLMGQLDSQIGFIEKLEAQAAEPAYQPARRPFASDKPSAWVQLADYELVCSAGPGKHDVKTTVS